MKTINAPVLPNGYHSSMIEAKSSTSERKRQSRRQNRHQLKKDLRSNLQIHLDDAHQQKQLARAAMTTSAHVSAPRAHSRAPSAVSPRVTATILQFPAKPAAHHNDVLVIRRLSKATVFERRIVEVTRIAA